MSCALALSRAGVSVTVFESNETLGGRARRVTLPDGTQCDNGQHLLLGAYSETLAAIASVNSRPASELYARIPLTLTSAKSYDAADDVKLTRPPVPLIDGLLMFARATGLSLADKLSLARYLASVVLGRTDAHTQTVADAIANVRAVPRERILAPLCLAALSTPAQRASAQVFHTVLRATFKGGRTASDMLVPKVDLTALFPEPAAAQIVERGGSVFQRETIFSIHPSGAGVELVSRARTATFDHCVLAVPPTAAGRFLAAFPGHETLSSALASLAFEPITTYRFAQNAPVTQPLVRGIADPRVQWLITHPDRATRNIVVSGQEAHTETNQAARVQVIAEIVGLPTDQVHAITEKRATISCTPQQAIRLQTVPSAQPPLWLAGDYCYPAFPSTIEAAVRSGNATAGAIIRHIQDK